MTQAKKRIFVTGGAGFIGSTLCARFLAEGHAVTAYDNLSLGRKEFLSECLKHPEFKFVQADLLDLKRLTAEMADHDLVYHMAANSDISEGAKRTDLDLQVGTVATYNTCEAMRLTKAREIVFASTSAIYGEASVKPTPENYGPLLPISFYGASKLACEALLTAFAHNYNFKVWIYRFANIVGRPSTHGAIHDFVGRLMKDPSHLKVLGNGTQKKSYLHITDCVDGMIYGQKNMRDAVNLVNLASVGVTSVRFIAEETVRQYGANSKIQFGEEDRGWRGDVPFTWLDGSKFESTGWRAKLDSDAAVRLSIQDVLSDLRARV